MKLIYVLVYFIPGSFDPIETGMQFDSLDECNAAAFEMADSFEMNYSLQCVPQDSGEIIPRVSLNCDACTASIQLVERILKKTLCDLIRFSKN
jgi:hypothetical protein